MPRIGMLTTGPILVDVEEAKGQEYNTLTDKIFAQFNLDQGAIAFTAGTGEEASSELWGQWTIPDTYKKDAEKTRILQTLSIWQDLESMVAYSYHGIHAVALKKRDDWFKKIPIPNHAIWWIADEHQPTWTEATPLYDRIMKQGTSAQAFNMKDLYDAEGKSIKLNQKLLKEKAKLYSTTS